MQLLKRHKSRASLSRNITEMCAKQKCSAIKCCERKSSLVIEVNKTERQPVIIFPNIPSRDAEFKCMTPRQNKQFSARSHANTLQEKHSGLMAFCVSFGVDKRNSATASGVLATLHCAGLFCRGVK